MELQPSLFALLLICGCMIFLGSVALWVVIGLRFRQRMPILPYRFRSNRVPVPMLAQGVVAVALLLVFQNVVVAKPDREFDVQRMERLVQASIIEGTLMSGVLLLLLLTLTRRRTDLSRLGFRCDEPLRQIAEGVLGFVAVLLPVFFAMLMTLPFRTIEVMHPFLRLIQERGVDERVASVALVAIVIAPLKEELMFRVVLQNGLVRWLGVHWGIGLTAVIFAAVHGFPDAVGILPLAVLLGVVYHRRRSVLAVIVLHAAFNAFNLIMLVASLMAQEHEASIVAFVKAIP